MPLDGLGRMLRSLVLAHAPDYAATVRSIVRAGALVIALAVAVTAVLAVRAALRRSSARRAACPECGHFLDPGEPVCPFCGAERPGGGTPGDADAGTG